MTSDLSCSRVVETVVNSVMLSCVGTQLSTALCALCRTALHCCVFITVLVNGIQLERNCFFIIVSRMSQCNKVAIFYKY